MKDFEQQINVITTEEDDPRGAIIKTIRESLGMLQEYAGLMFVYFEVLGMKDSDEKLHFNEQMSYWSNRFSEMWAKEIKIGQEKNLINKDIKPEAFARMLFSAVDGIMMHFIAFRPDKVSIKNQSRELEEMILDRLSTIRKDVIRV